MAENKKLSIALGIPTSVAKDIASAFGYPQVVIVAFDVGNNKQNITTYGEGPIGKFQSAEAGEYIMGAMGWEKVTCKTFPEIKAKGKNGTDTN